MLFVHPDWTYWSTCTRLCSRSAFTFLNILTWDLQPYQHIKRLSPTIKLDFGEDLMLYMDQEQLIFIFEHIIRKLNLKLIFCFIHMQRPCLTLVPLSACFNTNSYSFCPLKPNFGANITLSLKISGNLVRTYIFSAFDHAAGLILLCSTCSSLKPKIPFKLYSQLILSEFVHFAQHAFRALA